MTPCPQFYAWTFLDHKVAAPGKALQRGVQAHRALAQTYTDREVIRQILATLILSDLRSF